MADRYVTLTGTTVGTDISTVDIYHTSVTPSNLIVSGVTRAELLTGYTFLDDSSHDVYIIDSDSPCEVETTVNIAVSPTPTPSVTPSISVSPSVTPTQSVTPSITPTQSVTPTNTVTPTQSVTPTQTITPTVTTTVTPSTTATPSITPTQSVTPTQTITPTVTTTVTPSTTATPSITPTQTVTPTVSVSVTPTQSITPTQTVTPTTTSSITPSITTTPSVTPTNSVTPTVTTSVTPTQSITPTNSVTPTVTTSVTPTQSITPTNSVTPTVTATPTESITPSITPSITMTPSITPSTAQPLAYVLIQSNDDNLNNPGDLLNFMLSNGATSWAGFANGAGGFNAPDAAIWLDWPGWSAGTSNGSTGLTTTVDQSTYLFNPVELPSGTIAASTTMYPAIVIPTSSMSNGTYTLTDIGYDYTSGAGTSYANVTTDSVIRSISVTYSGGSFIPAGTYIVYYANNLNTSSNNTIDSYWKGNGKTP